MAQARTDPEHDEGGSPARPPRRKRQKTSDGAATFDTLIAVALKLFLHKGYNRTSMQDIVDASGLTKGAVYHHFDSKDDLLLIAHERYLQRELESLHRIRSLDRSATEKLRMTMVAMILGVVEHRAQLALFLEERRELKGDRFRRVREMRREFERDFIGLIEDGMEAGEFAAHRDARIVGLGVLGMLSWTYQWLPDDGPWTPAEVAETLAAVVLEGLVASGA